MKFQFNTSLTNVKVPGAEIEVGKVDVSISMEMEDEAYNSLVEMMYEQLSSMFGVPSAKSSEDEEPILNGSSPFP